MIKYRNSPRKSHAACIHVGGSSIPGTSRSLDQHQENQEQQPGFDISRVCRSSPVLWAQERRTAHTALALFITNSRIPNSKWSTPPDSLPLSIYALRTLSLSYARLLGHSFSFRTLYTRDCRCSLGPLTIVRYAHFSGDPSAMPGTVSIFSFYSFFHSRSVTVRIQCTIYRERNVYVTTVSIKFEAFVSRIRK